MEVTHSLALRVALLLFFIFAIVPAPRDQNLPTCAGVPFFL